jgi:ParB-like chromosome segregation protein Spo0J
VLIERTNVAQSLEGLVRPIEEVVPDPANARKHSERNISTIKASLVRFGQLKPIVLASDGKTIIAGNGTWYAAKMLGWTHIAAAVSPLAEAEAVAFGIADNRTAELAEWDDETLTTLLDALPGDLQQVAGFDANELSDLLKLPEDFEEVLNPLKAEDVCPQCGQQWSGVNPDNPPS